MIIYCYRLLPATSAMPRPRPTAEYVKDMTAATMDSHQTWSKSGICENITSVIPKAIIYPFADMWHGSFPPLLWKQFDLFIALKFWTESINKTVWHPCCFLESITKATMGTYIMLTDAAIVYPIAVPAKFRYWINPHIVTFLPPSYIKQEIELKQQLSEFVHECF